MRLVRKKTRGDKDIVLQTLDGQIWLLFVCKAGEHHGDVVGSFDDERQAVRAWFRWGLNSCS